MFVATSAATILSCGNQFDDGVNATRAAIDSADSSLDINMDIDTAWLGVIDVDENGNVIGKGGRQ